MHAFDSLIQPVSKLQTIEQEEEVPQTVQLSGVIDLRFRQSVE